ncbi:MAG: VanZ family protein [Patescibacteria group bacterium]|nr:VanZ family protein [Patescibacteria group bacterium]
MKKTNSFKDVVIYWIPALAWAGLIFYLSDISELKTGLSTPYEIAVRKVTHMLEFGILSVLVMRIAYKRYNISLAISFLTALAVTTLYAVSDEFHQIFVIGRDGNVKDIFVDFLGAYIFLHFAAMKYSGRVTKKTVSNVLIAITLFIFLVFMLVQESIKAQEVQLQQEISRTDSNLTKEKLDQNQDDALVVIEKQEKERENTQAEKKETENLGIIKIRENAEHQLPLSVLIDVPFSSQAPFGIWDDVHEEACEEMSLIMVKYYLDGNTLTPAIAEKEIQDMKKFQLEQYGHYKDSTMEELVKMAEEYYGIRDLRVIYDFDRQEIKKQLARKKPVIVPTAGRRLGNPNFTYPGPLYHNLVLIGYDENNIITNDPGTRKGKQYQYSIDILYNAIHDFKDSKEKIEQGRKAMVVLE